MLTELVNKIVQYNNPQIDCQLELAQKFSQISKKRREIICDILELYQCRPKEEYFDHYSADAIFEDPICSALNRKELQSQFMMMPQVFSRSTTTQINILHSDEHEIVLDLFQWYETLVMGIRLPVRSMVRLVFDSEDKIVYHGDYWYHTAAFDRVRGIIGFTWKQLRRLNGAAMPYVAPLVVTPTLKEIPDVPGELLH